MKKMISRNYVFNILVFFLAALLASCVIQTSDTNQSITQGNGYVFESDTQELAALAFISYAGEKLTLDDFSIEKVLPACISNEIQRQAVTKGKYQLVWGPAVYRFELAKLDDNMMYVVKDTENQGNLVVAIRGTNGGAGLDWISEDFYVNKTKKWTYGRDSSVPVPPNTCISEGTDIGLNILQQLKPKPTTTPGYNTTVIDYLRAAVTNGALNQVTVVGHSLAGALAPTYALWLKDTQKTWDPAGEVKIKVTALAGATPGNKQFSDYYGDRLGKQTNRLHNPYDAVPHAWYLPSLKQIPYLYTSAGIDATAAEKLIIDAGVGLSKATSCTQILPVQPALSGQINSTSSYETFISQVGWQHSCGYYCALGIASNMLNTNSYCVTDSFCISNPNDAKCKALKNLRCDCPKN